MGRFAGHSIQKAGNDDGACVRKRTAPSTPRKGEEGRLGCTRTGSRNTIGEDIYVFFLQNFLPLGPGCKEGISKYHGWEGGRGGGSQLRYAHFFFFLKSPPPKC